MPALLPLLHAARRYYPELIAHLAEDGETDTGYAVVGALRKIEAMDTSPEVIAANAQRFSVAAFERGMRRVVDSAMRERAA